MDQVNIHAAKTQFSKLIARVQNGEEILIAKAGRPVARLVPANRPVRRVPGTSRQFLTIREDFDDPLPPDIMKYFEP
ncbi:MAG: type II toxin-antitoxin system Phd/YefM family antitoxin [Acidobacteriota bacterium]|nr:type II toxin-antitoxin system Phd/YefM family antitoxin [Acidobacteriota bacterium]